MDVDALRAALGDERQKNSDIVRHKELLSKQVKDTHHTLSKLREALLKVKCELRGLLHLKGAAVLLKHEERVASVTGYTLDSDGDTSSSVGFATHSEDGSLEALHDDSWEKNPLYPAALKSVETAASKEGFPFSMGDTRLEEPGRKRAKAVPSPVGSSATPKPGRRGRPPGSGRGKKKKDTPEYRHGGAGSRGAGRGKGSLLPTSEPKRRGRPPGTGRGKKAAGTAKAPRGRRSLKRSTSDARGGATKKSPRAKDGKRPSKKAKLSAILSSQ